MLRISVVRLLVWLALGVLLYVGAQYMQVYFYASAFDDFIKDEVKFAPTRESTDNDHLRAHITEASTQYGMTVDPATIKIEKSHDYQQGTSRLEVNVAYTGNLDLHYRNYPVHFRTDAVIVY